MLLPELTLLLVSPAADLLLDLLIQKMQMLKVRDWGCLEASFCS